jgi:prenyltransferase beta subunit
MVALLPSTCVGILPLCSLLVLLFFVVVAEGSARINILDLFIPLEVRVMIRLIAIALATIVCPVPLWADGPGDKATVAYVQKLQTGLGGFLLQQPSPETRAVPTLRSTSSGVRTLHYLKGSIPHQEACAKFVADCYDAGSGGFADIPRGKADVATTAIGLMAVKELKMPVDQYGPGAVKYLSANARSFEDIRIAAAGLESIQAKSPKNQAWLQEVLASQNKDGTFGKGPGQARDTASVVVTILRLGGSVKDKGRVLQVLRDGQRPSGGYGKVDNEIASDLESTYRVMRCFMMLKAQPDRVEGVRTFIAKCRNGDGGYGVGPGQSSSLSGTYYAAIIRFWLDQ